MPEELITRYRILPIREDDDSLWAVSDQKCTRERLNLLGRLFPDRRVQLNVVTSDQFKEWVCSFWSRDLMTEALPVEDKTLLDVTLENVFKKALRLNASDISLEEQEQHFKVCFRVDGDWLMPEIYPSEYGKTILARVRTLAHLNPGKFLNVQESHFEVIIDGVSMQFRLSEIATVSGSNMVLRIFSENHLARTIDTLNMPESILNSLKCLFLNPIGLLLVTGPTGSGKTTTLYSFLRYLNSETKKILTIEDPIEFPLKNVVQTEITPKIGFASMLKALLRQDPDILMLGEIRDKETASIATQAALTGHFVLSTVHSKSTIDVIWRMLELSVDRFSLASALTGILSQRLLKIQHDDQLMDKDHSGDLSFSYWLSKLNIGRKAIFEWLPIGDHLRQVITNLELCSAQSLLSAANSDGLIPFGIKEDSCVFNDSAFK